MLRRQIQRKDVVLFESDFDFSGDKRKAGYNIGDLLNMPFLSGFWDIQLNASERSLLIADICTNSILANYIKSRPEDEPIPNIERIKCSTDQFINEHISKISRILSVVASNDTLTVHVRSGDRLVENNFKQIIWSMSKKFKKVILLSGVHMDEYFQDHEKKISDFVRTMNEIMARNNNIFVYFGPPDVHIALMKKASNLLVHQGGFSTIGTIVSEGKLYIQSSCTIVRHDHWKKLVNKSFITV